MEHTDFAEIDLCMYWYHLNEDRFPAELLISGSYSLPPSPPALLSRDKVIINTFYNLFLIYFQSEKLLCRNYIAIKIN